jgi:transposase-like protein
MVEGSVSEDDDRSVRRRRRWPVQEKLRIVLETLDGDASVPMVARRHNLNANQLFIWRSAYRRGELVADGDSPSPVKLLPVRLQPSPAPQGAADERRKSNGAASGCLEIQQCGARHVKVWGAMDPEALRVVIQELLRPC